MGLGYPQQTHMAVGAQRAFDAEEVADLDYVYIQKPFGKPVLARAIRDALDSQTRPILKPG